MTSKDYEMHDWMYSIDDWILRQDNKFKYQLLSRMKQDCQYYLRLKRELGDDITGNCLWAGEPKKQIATMKHIWLSFYDNDKPEWLTWEEILEFESKMITR